jgi:hypothetical protein
MPLLKIIFAPNAREWLGRRSISTIIPRSSLEGVVRAGVIGGAGGQNPLPLVSTYDLKIARDFEQAFLGDTSSAVI